MLLTITVSSFREEVWYKEPPQTVIINERYELHLWGCSRRYGSRKTCPTKELHSIIDVYKISPKQNVLIILCLDIAITARIASNITFGLATPENKTLMEPQGVHGMSNTNNAT
jgi:hypothetical protein